VGDHPASKEDHSARVLEAEVGSVASSRRGVTMELKKAWAKRHCPAIDKQKYGLRGSRMPEPRHQQTRKGFCRSHTRAQRLCVCMYKVIAQDLPWRWLDTFAFSQGQHLGIRIVGLRLFDPVDAQRTEQAHSHSLGAMWVFCLPVSNGCVRYCLLSRYPITNAFHSSGMCIDNVMKPSQPPGVSRLRI
jgi:hypothetical protein